MNNEKIIDNVLLFTEIQRFRQIWIWLLVFLLVGTSWTSFFMQIVLGKPFGANPASDTLVWIIFITFGIGLPWLLYSIKLIVEVREDGIYIRFFPLSSRKVYFKDLKTFEVRKYNPIAEYGGWGIRWAPGRGRAYNVSGNLGVQLELLSGARILIGSQKPEELAQSIEKAMKHYDGNVHD